MHNDVLESRILAFEQAWQQSRPPDIADFLDQPHLLTSPERIRLLVELICIDLEFRWHTYRDSACYRERFNLDGYAARFPELGPADHWPLELIGEEYRVRQRWGDRPTHSKFLAQFPARHELIREELLRIDRDLAEESTDSRHGASCVRTSAALETQPDRSHDGVLLSHHDFLLERMIGAGYMGKVYQAWQKSASPAGRRQIPALSRFSMTRGWFNGSSVKPRLSPGCVTRISLGRTVSGSTPGGAYFIVMDLVTGSDLARLRATGPISVSDAIEWAIQTCDALAHAHERRIIHCDLKPANLLRDSDGHIWVTDFGLARSLSEQTPWTAEVEGTAPFMAPEQASRCWGPFDERTVIYGLGAVLFTLLTGRPLMGRRRLPEYPG